MYVLAHIIWVKMEATVSPDLINACPLPLAKASSKFQYFENIIYVQLLNIYLYIMWRMYFLVISFVEAKHWGGWFFLFITGIENFY